MKLDSDKVYTKLIQKFLRILITSLAITKKIIEEKYYLIIGEIFCWIPHIIGEKLTKLFSKNDQNCDRNGSQQKISGISLSNNEIKRRIAGMCINIKK